MRKRPSLDPEAGWFGFSKAGPGEKTERVGRVFDSVAARYDLMNDLMSGGFHRLWKNRLVSMMRPRPGQTVLDVAGGTGDIALRCAKKTDGKARVIVCDINPAMIEIGRAKAVDHGYLPHPAHHLPLPQGERDCRIEWVAGNAEVLPFPSRSVDAVCIAFGLRNVTRIDTALAEFARVLKPGGRFFCLEFSPGVAPWLRDVYDLYSFAVLPWLGERVAKDREAYRYLAESIRQFPDQASLARRMEKAGFDQVKWRNLTGGIAAIHSGWKL